VVQQPLSEMLGQPIVIENKSGASGMVGAEAVAKAAPDGYTLLLGNIASLAINVGIYQKMPYDPLKDFTPIIRTVDVNYVLVVHPSLPVKTVPELIAYAKANPGRLSYGSAGSGSLPHLGTELFKAQTGTDMVHVPYKGGGPMVTDLLGGNVQLVIADQANLMPHVTSGKLRALAVATPKRSPNAPDLPTIAETAIPGFEATAWQGLVGPGACRRTSSSASTRRSTRSWRCPRSARSCWAADSIPSAARRSNSAASSAARSAVVEDREGCGREG
jgi:tripartite-type tricarboxylate transporter receptor subunit TctC